MTERSYRGLLWTLAFVGLALDQGSKYVFFRYLPSDGRTGSCSVIADTFELLAQYKDGSPHVKGGLFGWLGWLPPESANLLAQIKEDGSRPHVNQGALFGWQGWLPPHWSNSVFALVSVAAAGVIIWWSTRLSTIRDWSLCAALGLILAGTVGNLYDRVVFSGVRDFVRWHYKDVFEWPVFNIADCCLVCGAFLLLTQALWVRPVPDEATTSSPMIAEPATAQTSEASVS